MRRTEINEFLASETNVLELKRTLPNYRMFEGSVEVELGAVVRGVERIDDEEVEGVVEEDTHGRVVRVLDLLLNYHIHASI